MSTIPISTNYPLEAKGTAKAAPAKQLHEWIVYDPQKDYSKNICWSRLWTVATYATMVAFVGFAAVGFVFTIVFAEFYAPVIIAAVMLGMQPSLGVLNWMYNKSNAYVEEAKKAEKILTQFKKLDDGKLKDTLDSIGISLTDISEEQFQKNPALLKSLIARFKAYKKIQEEAEERATLCIKTLEIPNKNGDIVNTDPRKIDPAVHLSFFQKAQKDLAYRENLLLFAAKCNLEAAYMLKILQNPREEKKQQEYFKSFMSEDSLLNIVAGYYQNPHAQDMLVTTDGRTFTRDQIRTMDTLKLAQEIYSLKLSK